MDIKTFIESGILENYVLGLTSEIDTEEVEKNLLQYPELKIELNQIEAALATYAQSKAMPMPAGLSAQIIQSINDLSTSSSPTSDTTTAATKPQAAMLKGANALGIFLASTEHK